jgi:hypothetical protein
LITLVLAGLSAHAYGQSGGGIQCALEEAKLLANDGSTGDYLGWSIAISGETVVAGAPNDDDKGIQAGAAYVFARTGGVWTQQAKLLASDGFAGDQFGWSVAISGDTVVVGAPYGNFFNFDQGVAYVFQRTGTEWTQQKKFALVLSQDDHFGWSVAIDGDTIAVGMPNDSYGGQANLGRVFVYVRDGQTWTLAQQLTASNGAGFYVFGRAVSVSGDRILVGSPGAQSGNGRGAAYAFQRQRSSWLEESILVSPTPQIDNFGYAVSISGDTAVVGAYRDPCAGFDAGAAYVFVDQGSTWTLQQKLIGDDTTDKDQFGYAVSIDQDRILIGSPGKTVQGLVAAGAGYQFSRVGTSWTQGAKAYSSVPQFNEIFGFAVALDSTSAAVGVPSDDENGLKSGSAYAFQLLGAPATYCTAKPNSCGALPAIAYTGVPSASASGPFVVSASGSRALKSGLLLYTDSGRGSLPFSGGTLCIASAPVKRSIAVTDTAGTPGHCDGTLSIDMNAFATGTLGGNPLPSLTIPGTQVNCQFWGRDTIANGALLTDALEYFVCE